MLGIMKPEISKRLRLGPECKKSESTAKVLGLSYVSCDRHTAAPRTLHCTTTFFISPFSHESYGYCDAMRLSKRSHDCWKPQGSSMHPGLTGRNGTGSQEAAL